ncbi:NADP-dependent oxidoreductase [Streptomyces sp. NPDC093984]|uniref:NADP-dependent oxidoreductase n=1 Tax=Streptomyces sp. NPDC093984 TaxID=3366052 RepID=UPI00382E0AB7
MKAIVVTDQAAETAGMTLVERPEPQAALNDVVVQVHASGFMPGELTWFSTWTDRFGRDRTPSIPGQEPAGVVSALGYGTTGLSVSQRVFGLEDGFRGGTLAEYVAIEVRNLAPLPADVDYTVGAALPMPGLTAWQGLFEHGRLQAGKSVLVHGAAGAVGSMVTQFAREAGAYTEYARAAANSLLESISINERLQSVYARTSSLPYSPRRRRCRAEPRGPRRRGGPDTVVAGRRGHIARRWSGSGKWTPRMNFFRRLHRPLF